MNNSSNINLAVFVSGSGSNLQSLIDASNSGQLSARVNLVVSNKSKAYGLERAKIAGIDRFVYKENRYSDKEEAGIALFDKLKEYDIDYIALAGYLRLLPEIVVKEYKNRIVNIHPALLPKYGGKGMYGHFVHEAVILNKDTKSGVTVHLVDEIYDNGQILDQREVDVLESDTPESLAAKVLVQEHLLYPQVIENLIKGKYEINNE